MDVLSEVVAAAIGTAELMNDPRYPDGEDRCSEIAREYLCRVSRNITVSRAEASRQRIMVMGWRSAADRVISVLQGRGVILR